MKPEQDAINWHNVHRSHELNEEADPQGAQLQFWKQRLHNLQFVSLTEPDYCRLLEEYTLELKRLEEASKAA